MAGEPDGSEDTVRGMFGPDVTFLGVPRAEPGTRPVRGPAVERRADEDDVQFGEFRQ